MANDTTLPPPPAGAVPLNQGGGLPPLPAGATPYNDESQNQDVISDQSKRLDFNLKEIGKEGGLGAAMGAFAPEILQYGVAPAATLIPGFGEFAAPAIYEAGTALKGSRLAGAASGALSGAGGETAGQAVEKGGHGTTAAESARLLGSIVTPMPFEALNTGLGKVLSSTVGKFIPGMTTAKTLGKLLEENNIDTDIVKNLSKDKQEFIEKRLSKLRGGKEESLQAQKEIFSMLQQEADRIQVGAEGKAGSLMAQADALEKEAKEKGGQITSEMNTRINNLRSQWDSAANKLRIDASNRAREVQVRGSQWAAQLRKNAEGRSQNERMLAEIDAKQAEKQAYQEAQTIVKQEESNLAEAKKRFSEKIDRIRGISKGVASREQAIKETVGTGILPSDVGTRVRNSFDQKLTELKAARDEKVAPMKKAVEEAIATEQAAGKSIRDTKAYQEGMNQLDAMLKEPRSGRLMETDPKIKNAIENFKKEINPERNYVDESGVVQHQQQPIDAHALFTLYRRYKDRASGLPAEGVEAIDQQTAGKLAKIAEGILDDFTKGAHQEFKQTYSGMSEPINKLMSGLGQFVTEKPEGFAVGDYFEKLRQVGSKSFAGRAEAEQLANIAGHEEANQIAAGYMADQLKSDKLTSDKVRSLIYDNRDWINLDEYAHTKQAFEKLANDLSRATSQQARLDALSKVLKTEMGGLKLPNVKPDLTKTNEILKAGELKSKEALKKGEKYASELEKGKAGEIREGVESQITAGAKEVESRASQLEKEAAKQAGEIKSQAETEASGLRKEAEGVKKEADKASELLLGKTTDATRVKQFLTGANRAEWEAISEVIKAHPEGRTKIADAVGQIIADQAKTSISGASKTLKEMGDNLVDYGLMDKSAIDAMNKALQEMYALPADQSIKSTFLQRRIRDAIIGAGVVSTDIVGRIVK
jgi:hypothetical protein